MRGDCALVLVCGRVWKGLAPCQRCRLRSQLCWLTPQQLARPGWGSRQCLCMPYSIIWTAYLCDAACRCPLDSIVQSSTHALHIYLARYKYSATLYNRRCRDIFWGPAQLGFIPAAGRLLDLECRQVAILTRSILGAVIPTVSMQIHVLSVVSHQSLFSPSPLVSSAPIWILLSASELSRACASVFAAQNSTPCTHTHVKD